jgi:diacylglycerol O-acyltransferase
MSARECAPGRSQGGTITHLSATDTSFLLQERGGAHMHIGGVLVFEGPAPSPERVRAHIAERLWLVPRFRQRLAQPPLPISRPWWVDDPEFDIDYHLRRAALPRPGTDRQLQRLVAEVFSERLDRRKPLWEMYVVEGLRDDRFAVITKAHHALVDGIAGVDLASVILDVAPEPVAVGGTVIPLERRPAPSKAELLVRGLKDAAAGPLAAAEFLAGGGLFYPRRLTRAAAKVAGALGEVGWELLNPAPDSPLNGPIGPHRRYEVRHAPLAQARAIARANRATINDVVLAAATGALRRWLRSRGIRPSGLELRALVPVNLRDDRERGLLGNRVALLRAPLPVWAEHPQQRLALVRDGMRQIKRSRQLASARTIIELSEFAPPTILAQASRLQFSPRLFNLIITNVPGPQLPLYLLGRRLEWVAPVAFLPRGHGLSIAVFSYDGRLSFGLLGDYDRLEDISLVADGLAESLAELAEPQPIRAPRAPAPHRALAGAPAEPVEREAVLAAAPEPVLT